MYIKAENGGLATYCGLSLRRCELAEHRGLLSRRCCVFQHDKEYMTCVKR